MKTTKIKSKQFWGAALIWLLCTLNLNACNFFYGGNPGTSYNDMFDAMWKDYKETYALFEVRNVDWEEQYRLHKPNIRESMTDKEFFDECADMLYTLKDSHVYIKTPFGSMNSGEDIMPPDAFSLNEVCAQYIDNPQKCGNNIIT